MTELDQLRSFKVEAIALLRYMTFHAVHAIDSNGNHNDNCQWCGVKERAREIIAEADALAARKK